MDYRQAKKIREKSFGTLLAEQEGGFGQSLKAAISQKTKAKVAGIKETFDPLNIAKKLTFGSNFAPAILGKLIGADKKRVDYFSGVKPKHTASLESGGSSMESPEELESLGYIYKALKQWIDDKHQVETDDKESKQKEDEEEDTRNEELIKALTGRKKKKEKPTKKEPSKEESTKKEPPKKKPTNEKPTKGKPSTTKVETPTNTPSVPKTSGVSTAAKVATGVAIVAAGLGSASAKFESRGDASTVSSGKNDPGGISYGTYQMSSVEGVADDFVKKSKWNSNFKGLKAGTPEFSAKWKEIATDSKQAKDFAEAQHEYIKKTHFDPAASVASKMGYQLSDPGVADAIWSLSVQHGNYKAVLNLSKQNMGGIIKDDPKEQIKSLYKARGDYVNGNSKLDAGMKSNIQKRYSEEVGYALQKSTGNILDSSSKENKNLKADANAEKDKSAPVVNSNTNNQNNQQKSAPGNQGDDRNAYSKKAQS